MLPESVRLFSQELDSILQGKPPISRAKMASVSRAAMKAAKHYKHVVLDVEKFCERCPTEFKLPALYVIDAIVRQSRHQFGEKDNFGPRFSLNLETTFGLIMQCNKSDIAKVIRVLNLWLQNDVFTSDVINTLLEIATNVPEEEPKSPVLSALKKPPSTPPALLVPPSAVPKPKEEPSTSTVFDLIKRSKETAKTLEAEKEELTQLKLYSDSLTSDNNKDSSLEDNKFDAGIEKLLDFDYKDINTGESNTVSSPPDLLSSEEDTEDPRQPISLNDMASDISEDEERTPKKSSHSHRKRSKHRKRSHDSHRKRSHRRHRSRDRHKSKKRRKDRSRSRDRSRHRSTSRKRDKKSRVSVEDKQRIESGMPPLKQKHTIICSTVLWLGRIPRTASVLQIKELFNGFGSIQNLDMAPTRGGAYITLTSRQNAYKALMRLNNAVNLDGNVLKVSWAPNKSLGGKVFKEYWDDINGCCYVPWDKMPNDLDMFNDGGLVDRTTLPPMFGEKTAEGEVTSTTDDIDSVSKPKETTTNPLFKFSSSFTEVSITESTKISLFNPVLPVQSNSLAKNVNRTLAAVTTSQIAVSSANSITVSSSSSLSLPAVTANATTATVFTAAAVVYTNVVTTVGAAVTQSLTPVQYNMAGTVFSPYYRPPQVAIPYANPSLLYGTQLAQAIPNQNLVNVRAPIVPQAAPSSYPLIGNAALSAPSEVKPQLTPTQSVNSIPQMVPHVPTPIVSIAQQPPISNASIPPSLPHMSTSVAPNLNYQHPLQQPVFPRQPLAQQMQQFTPPTVPHYAPALTQQPPVPVPVINPQMPIPQLPLQPPRVAPPGIPNPKLLPMSNERPPNAFGNVSSFNAPPKPVNSEFDSMPIFDKRMMESQGIPILMPNMPPQNAMDKRFNNKDGVPILIPPSHRNDDRDSITMPLKDKPMVFPAPDHDKGVAINMPNLPPTNFDKTPRRPILSEFELKLVKEMVQENNKMNACDSKSEENFDPNDFYDQSSLEKDQGTDQISMESFRSRYSAISEVASRHDDSKQENIYREDYNIPPPTNYNPDSISSINTEQFRGYRQTFPRHNLDQRPIHSRNMPFQRTPVDINRLRLPPYFTPRSEIPRF